MNIISNNNQTFRNLKMCFITWNMHGKTPDLQSVKQLFKGYKDFDIYIIGTEECLRSIALSIVYWSKSSWEQDLTEAVGPEYQIVTSSTLSAIHIIAFAKKSIFKEITGLGYSYVKSGIMNMVGNKGAVCIWFKIKQASFLFINCHLASGKSNNDRRITDFNHILDTFETLNYSELFGKNYVANDNTILDSFSLCVYMGDFNWRIDKDVDFIQANIAKPQSLLLFDQFQKSIESESLNPRGFMERPIEFFPTYKYEHDSTTQHLYKGDERLPGWTDRILYKFSSLGISEIKFKGYTAIQNIIVSDHKPVILECYISL